jgi:hypothetical protein
LSGQENQRSRLKSAAAVLGAAAACSIYAWNLWGSPAFGLLADQPYHLNLAKEFNRAWQDGDFPPRWAATANGGRGSVAFVVYPPCFPFLTASWLRLGAGAVEALRLAVLSATLGIVGSILYLARSWLSWRRSLFAAAVTLLLPGVTFIALGRGMFPHYAALGWAALMLGAGQRTLLGRRPRLNASLAVAAAAGLILTHTLTAYLFVLLGLALSPLLARALSPRKIAAAAAMATIAAALTCWFWLPVLASGSYTRLNYLAESHPYLDSVLGASVPVESGVFRHDWIFLNDMGRYLVIAQALLALLLTLALLRNSTSLARVGSHAGRRLQPSEILFVRALPWVAGFALLAATKPGALLLLEFPRAALLQFSWRWQSLVSLWCGLALASLPWEKRSAPAAILALGIVGFFSPLLAPSKAPPREPRRDLPAILTKTQFDQLQPLDRAAFAGNLLEQRPNAVDSSYYLPAAFGAAEVVAGKARVEPQVLKTSYRQYRVFATGEATIRFRTYQAPGWSARLDSKPVDIRIDSKTGLQRIRVPSGNHRLELQYKLPWPWQGCGKPIHSSP